MFQLENEPCSQFETEDYVFDLEQALEQKNRQVAAFTTGGSDTLFGTLITGVMVDFNSCDTNLPHIHPHASEIMLVLEASSRHLT